jgi:hypothetical protein
MKGRRTTYGTMSSWINGIKGAGGTSAPIVVEDGSKCDSVALFVKMWK